MGGEKCPTCSSGEEKQKQKTITTCPLGEEKQKQKAMTTMFSIGRGKIEVESNVYITIHRV